MEPVAPPFAELMASLRGGAPEAARAVFDRFARRLVALAASRLPGPLRAKVDGEDVAQSVFRTFFRRQAEGQFRLESWDQLWTLLTVLTVRKCGQRLDELRAARRDVSREQRHSPSPDPSAAELPLVDPAPSPSEAAMLAETLQQVLAGLTERERPVVLLRLRGYTLAEVSRQVGCTERTVGRILKHVRDRLESRADE
jgi:RNA polymerase sigma-70 factor (ECF subfamily)